MITIFGNILTRSMTIGLILGLGIAQVNAAPIQYNYQGNALNNAAPSGFSRSPLSGFIVVDDSTLGGSTVSKTFTAPVSVPTWSLTDGVNPFNQSNASGFLGFHTNASGDIAEWYIFVGVGPYIMTSYSSGAVGVWGVQFTNLVNSISNPNPVGDLVNDNSNFRAWNTTPGTWTKVTSNTPIPEPGFFSLLSLAMVGLVFARRLRS